MRSRRSRAVHVHNPNEFLGDIMGLGMEKARPVCDHTTTLDGSRSWWTATLPVERNPVDFKDRLKSINRGYGSMD